MSSAVISTPATVPSHVPSDLIWDHDINTFACELDDPYLALARLHDGPDIVWARVASRGEPGWVPTRFALLQELFVDARRFSSSENIGVGEMLGVDWKLNPLEIDPPAHAAYRMVLQPWFQPSAINKLEPMIRAIARELIAKFEQRGGCEFVADFASLFPSYVFLAMLGLPREQLPQFLEWEHAFIHSTEIPEKVASARAIKAYLEDYLDRRRGDLRDDLVSGILNGKVDGRPLDHGEVMGMCMVLYFGGLDTVMSSIGWYLRHLVHDQGLQRRLRDNPSDIPGAVDDLLRAYGVVGTRRNVTEDLEFHGVQMKKGDVVLMPGYLASRDPHQYTNPHLVDPDRKARSLTLATGVHNCLGTHLAKREIKIVLEEWLARFANIRIPAGEKDSWLTQGVWTVTRLPLVWD
jgi:cytochrome P450